MNQDHTLPIGPLMPVTATYRTLKSLRTGTKGRAKTVDFLSLSVAEATALAPWVKPGGRRNTWQVVGVRVMGVDVAPEFYARLAAEVKS